MIRRALVTALLVLSTAGLSTAGPGTAPATASDTSAAAPDGLDYVALGDSYSAGPLIPTARRDPDGCLRSTNNYPAYLAGYLDVATYRDVTCSGARTSDFAHRQSLVVGTPAPPQLDALSADTDLVTVGIGGNDFGLFGSMVDTCQKVRDQDPEGRPCRAAFTTRVHGHRVDTLLRDARRIQHTVGHALALVHRRAPSAQVVVLGYPRLLPITGTCAEVPFAAGDYGWARHVERRLNRSIRNAAAGHRATYVNLYPAFLRHDACAGDQAWINGAQVKIGLALSFHPFQAGEREMARATYQLMTGLVAPTEGDAAPPAGSIVVNPVTDPAGGVGVSPSARR